MKIKRKPLLAAIVIFTLILSLWPATALAAGETGTTDIWNWLVLPDETLTITGCTSPTGDISVPSSLDCGGTLGTRTVTQIAANSFFNSDLLDRVTLPSSITSIGDAAFADCDFLQYASILNSSTMFGAGVFSGCGLLISDGRIISYNSSTAQAYAVASGIAFEYPELTSNIASNTIYVGGRITMTHNHPFDTENTWNYNTSMLSGDFSSPTEDNGVFTGLAAGTARVTYLYFNVPVSLDVTILASSIPATGQDFTWVFILLAAAVLMSGAALIIKRRVARS